MEIEIVEEGPDVWRQAIQVGSTPCIEPYIGIGELSRNTGLSPWKIRKWVKERIIPCCHRPGEHRIFPRMQAAQAIFDELERRLAESQMGDSEQNV